MKRTSRPQKQITILACDPSITAWGWAVVDQYGEVIIAGCIKTQPEQKKRRIRKGDDDVRRISELVKTLLTVIRENDISYIVNELPHGSQNASVAKMIGVVTGVMQTLADTLDIGIEWYSEGDAKKCLLGKTSATKREVINAISKQYDVPWTGTKYIDEAIADALAIHLVAYEQSATLKMMRRK